jgi:hypothetical protein
MINPLDAVQEALTGRYSALFGEPSWTFAESGDSLTKPCWIWQTDRLEAAASRSMATGALVLDPDVGACTYFIELSQQRSVRESISRALAVRQSLLPAPRHSGRAMDEYGSWRVVINWLVEERDFEGWITEVATLREKTGHFEEITADAIVCEDGDWKSACSRHGFPRLLFHVRNILSKSGRDDIERWRSADEAVKKEIYRLETSFSDELTSQCAKQAIQAALDHRSQGQNDAPDAPALVDLHSIGIRNFRNLRELDLPIRSHDADVSSTVIQGPNGSGKSAIFEALSFALAGASMRYVNYLDDTNRQVLARDDRYIRDYLTIREVEAPGPPQVSLNDGSLRQIELGELNDLKSRATYLSATLFSQECSQSLVAKSATALGAEVAGAFSGIAAAAVEYVDLALASAQEEQRAFNATWSLRGNVIRRQTVIEQVVARGLRQFAAATEGLLAWLRIGDTPSVELASQMRSFANGLHSWSASIERVATSVARSDQRDVQRKLLVDFLDEGLRLVGPIGEFVARISEAVSGWSPELDTQVGQLGEWYAARALRPMPSSGQLEHAHERRASLNERLQDSIREGNRLRAQKGSLESVRGLLPLWTAEHNDECPICASEVAARGGIKHIVSTMLLDVDGELDRLRTEYRRIQTDLQAQAVLISQLGGETPPIPYEDQPALVSQLSLLLAGGDTFEPAIADPTRRSQLRRLMAHFRSVPRIPDLPSTESSADGILETITKVSGQFERVASLPAAWKAVRDEMTKRLTRVVSDHLPRTTQAVWQELVHNMLPAPWQYPGQVYLRVSQSKKSNQVAVVVRSEGNQDALAAHLLNGAEVHNLGLGWFLTRYLTEGRFRYGALVLDDPAHSMDQPTFRDFCRLLETLLRLHRKESMKLSMIVLLHQDSRAVDAARATNGVLHQLRWNKRTPVSLRRIKLQDDGAGSPQPIPIRQRA